MCDSLPSELRTVRTRLDKTEGTQAKKARRQDFQGAALVCGDQARRTVEDAAGSLRGRGARITHALHVVLGGTRGNGSPAAWRRGPCLWTLHHAGFFAFVPAQELMIL